ncbi:hypothetical protein JW964_11090 [candidate division KSB1 bacterium]|nr:hypothetical protein [candidate division KSB1 bacterium]
MPKIHPVKTTLAAFSAKHYLLILCQFFVPEWDTVSGTNNLPGNFDSPGRILEVFGIN